MFISQCSRWAVIATLKSPSPCSWEKVSTGRSRAPRSLCAAPQIPVYVVSTEEGLANSWAFALSAVPTSPLIYALLVGVWFACIIGFQAWALPSTFADCDCVTVSLTTAHSVMRLMRGVLVNFYLFCVAVVIFLVLFCLDLFFIPF